MRQASLQAGGRHGLDSQRMHLKIIESNEGVERKGSGDEKFVLVSAAVI